PVYVYVKEGVTEINDATHLWGKADSYETQEKIKAEVGDKASVACIGLGGENLIHYANIMNDEGRAAGRCGMGALMGSKNLKAIVVSGTMKSTIAHSEQLKTVINEARDSIMSNIYTQAYKLYGTNFYMDLAMRLGDAPAKYFTKSVFPAAKIHGPAFRDRYRMSNYACSGCPIGCGRIIKDFSDDIKQVDGPEYETVGAFGPLCMNFDTDSIVMANHLCNTHGIDTISAGVSIAFAMHLYEKGILTKEKAGMEISWGDKAIILKLIEMIINQEGIGKLLSKGVKQMAAELGADPEEAAHVKGLEIPMHDPRAYQGAALAYAVLQFCELYNSFTLCQFSPIPASMIAQILANITGKDFKTMDLLTFGERSLNLKRAINNKLGVTCEDDKLPEIARKALNEGGTAGIEPDMDMMLKEFYTVSKWDMETGKPTKEKLMELGLQKVAEDLYG
ncbi:MAG: aldehyde ferredoxin oxidoreductase, partial [Deltaproteobacteria bacterium]|nr:aldehyde ferredoxin oxidoreductase [Deltaproteobacteria bacterium]